MNTPFVTDDWTTRKYYRALITYEPHECIYDQWKGWVGIFPDHGLWACKFWSLGVGDDIHKTGYFRDHVFPASKASDLLWWVGFDALDSDITENIRVACERLAENLWKFRNATFPEINFVSTSHHLIDTAVGRGRIWSKMQEILNPGGKEQCARKTHGSLL